MVWYLKYCLPDGHRVQEKLGPVWTERGRPATVYFTKRRARCSRRRGIADYRFPTVDR